MVSNLWSITQEGERYPLRHRGSNTEVNIIAVKRLYAHVIILTKEYKISITNIGHDPSASFLFCFEIYLFRL